MCDIAEGAGTERKSAEGEIEGFIALKKTEAQWIALYISLSLSIYFYRLISYFISLSIYLYAKNGYLLMFSIWYTIENSANSITKYFDER